ncbi:hypothetical protein ASF30_10415 [Leifsonia sp. Leaf264]|nr:hypothetical protein ASF30_10415 [Leifsonia sp. Leaf264]
MLAAFTARTEGPVTAADATDFLNALGGPGPEIDHRALRGASTAATANVLIALNAIGQLSTTAEQDAIVDQARTVMQNIVVSLTAQIPDTDNNRLLEIVGNTNPVLAAFVAVYLGEPDPHTITDWSVAVKELIDNVKYFDDEEDDGGIFSDEVNLDVYHQVRTSLDALGDSWKLGYLEHAADVLNRLGAAELVTAN